MPARRQPPSLPAGGPAVTAVVGPAAWVAASQSDLQQISPLVWTIVAISIAGAVITYGIMVYAIWRFHDPSTRRRNYG